MYLQIFRPNVILRYFIYAGLIATSVFYTGSTIAQFIFMTPRPGETLQTHWGTPLQLKILKFSVPHSAVGAVIDLYILGIPIVGIWQLQLAMKRKIGVMLIFMTGLMYVHHPKLLRFTDRSSSAVVLSFLSLYYRVFLNQTTDWTWALLPVLLVGYASPSYS